MKENENEERERWTSFDWALVIIVALLAAAVLALVLPGCQVYNYVQDKRAQHRYEQFAAQQQADIKQLERSLDSGGHGR